MAGLARRVFEFERPEDAKAFRRQLRQIDVSGFVKEDALTVEVGPIPLFANGLVSEIVEGFGDLVLEVKARGRCAVGALG